MVLRRPAPRFVMWVALLVGVAAVGGVAGLSGWIIAAVEFGAWLAVAVCERALTEWTLPRSRVYLEPPDEYVEYGEDEEDEPAELAEPPEPAPVVAATAVAAPSTAGATSVVTPEGTKWSMWALEQVVRERAPDDEELGFLVVYLRDFAGADGLLPAGFDSLVRESFGELLADAG